jgi:hypothetical protein
MAGTKLSSDLNRSGRWYEPMTECLEPKLLFMLCLFRLAASGLPAVFVFITDLVDIVYC